MNKQVDSEDAEDLKDTDSLNFLYRFILERSLDFLVPAFLFWRSYVEYDPNSFTWWIGVIAGLLILVRTAHKVTIDEEDD